MKTWLKKIQQPTTGNRGDTIVEVAISMAILISVLATAYVLSGHALRSSTSANERTAALTDSQAQVEHIKNAFTTNNKTSLDSYKQDGKPFCIAADGSKQIPNKSDPYNKDNPCLTDQKYALSIVYDQKTNQFTMTTTWLSNLAAQPDNNLALYYRLPVSYVIPNLSLIANPSEVENNTSSSLTWSSSNVSNSHCTASSNPLDPQWGGPIKSNTSGGPKATSLLTAQHTYKLECTDLNGRKISKTATVSIKPSP